ncbi:fungal-specific transcription factor domain-containing protein [Apiospora phragmitis]|uniref:Fungal-specific transcription factor domain-containing protein n=1 Tax=Apiospora phragmitis TaxID=2905665 RepID=A0ABR1VZ22_9PEZI
MPAFPCQDFGADCIYLPPKSMTIHRDHRDYQQKSVQAVEDRVAELELIIRREGISDTRKKRKRRTGHDGQTNALTPVECVEPPTVTQWKPSPAPSDSRSDIMSQSFSQQPRVPTGTVMDILGDLSIEAPGAFFSTSSHITMSRVIASIIRAREERAGAPKQLAWEQLSPDTETTSSASSDDAPEFLQISAGNAQRLFDCYLSHFATRWPVLQTSFIRLLHTERDNLSDAFFTSVLHLVYAIAGQYLKAAGEIGGFFPEQHLAAAMKNLNDIPRFHGIRSIQFLLLLSIHSLRSPEGPGAWTYIGLAMRQCIDLGLHRKTRKFKSLLEYEMRKRVFWTCYCIDRQLSISMGRPFAISDRDIDVEFPLDIDEATEELEVLQTTYQASKLPGSRKLPQSTTMTGFIHLCKLRVMESHIQQSIYRVDQSTTATDVEVEGFLEKLEGWKSRIPLDASSPYTQTTTGVGYDTFVRILPQLRCKNHLRNTTDDPFVLLEESQTTLVRRCADACGGVCRTYKKLHQVMPIGFSSIDLSSVFSAGMTLIYCAWVSPKEVLTINNSNDMNACSIVLYIITERLPAARKYRDAYEMVKLMVLKSIEENRHEARQPVAKLRPCIQTALDALNFDQNDEQGKLSTMISVMAGEPAPLSEDASSSSAPTERTDAVSPTSGELNQGLPLDGIPLDFEKADTYNAMDLQLGTIFAAPGPEWTVKI